MARIRTIKPEFFTSADIVSLSPLARLLYIGLWCEADREGRLSWNLKTLKLRYLPVDNESIETLATELIEAGLIILYTADDRQYAEIPSFVSHQIINNKETCSHIPSRVKDASGTRHRGRKEGREGKGKEGKEGDGTELPPEASAPSGENVFVMLPANDGSDVVVTESQIAEWENLFPAVDVRQELRGMRAWLLANQRNRKTPTGMLRFVTSWLSREQDKPGRRAKDSQPDDNGPLVPMFGARR